MWRENKKGLDGEVVRGGEEGEGKSYLGREQLVIALEEDAGPRHGYEEGV